MSILDLQNRFRGIFNFMLRKYLFVYYRIKFPSVKFGTNIKYYSLPLFYFYKNCDIRIGNNVVINSNTKNNLVGLYKKTSIFVAQNAKLRIGENTGLSGVSIYCSKEIIIGKYVNIGGNVSIWDTDFHPLEYKHRRIHDITKIKSKAIFIDDDAFIGANSIILKGTCIGRNSIIAAGSVVRGNIPENQIWGGNPVRFIKKIDE